ncbi:hypothetical protein [Clostridium paraputrificum]|uniref:hypothetical protein n=1 Tax=Clostridium paraputrificum TaxID=29363 RepID=UPI0003FDA7DF|nr:hypothetical protein [Clostridium paraputrificum]
MRNNKTFNEIHNEFRNYKENDNEARKIKEIYERVEMEYRENKELNIMLEKAMVKRHLDEYMPWTLNYYFQIMIIVFTVFITGVWGIKDIFKDNILLMLFGLVLTLAFIFFFMLLDKKSINKENSKHIYYSICLDILNKLEQEYV